ncbi:NADPH:quinone reductase [Halobaculum sp. CBA1158]|uniref:NADPH:quinone reductase n=1 Tax=Halobaculum sp. CBA1158 TaxID=2904243 RepID=UPI001F3D48CB|nr:NADPH:quinone reductase [Halobaculum sp. CBA1158]UIO99481.1 NADPH:quinone reductase [Halobaculum sp. CBA1158]
MRAVRFHEHGDESVLQVEELDRPDPAPDEVLVEVAAAGVNPVDTYFREGSYEPYGLPAIPGVDAAGEAVAVGEAVEGVAVGDPVVATGLSSTIPGGYAEYVAVPDDRFAVLPAGADLVAAGGAGVAAVTAWRALIQHATLRPAETVLIHGGSGGVGHAAVQVAAATGAHTIATAAEGYHDAVRGLGADAVFDYGRDDLAAAITDAAGGDGVDVILDHRLDEYLGFDAEVAAQGCRVVGIGENDPAIGFPNSAAARGTDLNLQLMSMFNTPSLADALADIGSLWGEDVSIEVADSYGLEEAAEAQQDVMTESFLGKLVIEP